MRIASKTAVKSIAVFLCLCAAGSASACRVPPTAERTESALRLLIEKSDYVIIGRVAKVLRRRWNGDDTRPSFPASWIEITKKRSAGEDVGSDQYIANWVEFAEATAYLVVDEELFWTGLQDKRTVAGQRELLPIDLLRPFAVGGHGPCHSFPKTCPWDVNVGEQLAVAIKENRFGVPSALVCSRTPPLSHDDREQIRRLNKFTTKYDALLPYLSQFR